jgi:leucyl aminopeptidase
MIWTLTQPCKAFQPAHRPGRKQFFFEKKNQKTFILLANAADVFGTHQTGQKFFGSFFQKRTAVSALPIARPFTEPITDSLRSDYGLSISVRKLDCLATPGESSVPVYAVRSSGFSAATNAIVLVPGRDGIAGAVLGLGEKGGPGPFGALAFGLPERLAWRMAGPVDCVEDAMLAFCLGAYRFDSLKSVADRKPSRQVPAGEPMLDRIVALAETSWFVRDLINLPANHLGPAQLADAACAVLRPLGAEVSVVEGADLDTCYPLIAAVGAASARPPRVVKATWQGAHGTGGPLISLCGKGVCFDTGGYDIKPASGMLRMKKDMGGAAVALGIARLIILADLPVRLELRLACVENSIAGNAMRPLDILRSRRGLTVAVANTDAEGRLLLADLLAEASDAGPDMLLDFATLTGAARVALGPDVAAFFCNNDALAAEIETAARVAQDPVWRMPLHAGYDSLLDGDGCDLKNISDKPYAGAIMAALFLQRFLAPATNWAHFDLYGWNDSGRPGRPEGGDAQCMRAAYAAIVRCLNVTARDARFAKM